MAGELASRAVTEPILQARNLTKIYSSCGLFSRRAPVRALDGVNLDIFAGRTVALVGETGSGKSTLARCLARLDEPTSGQIIFEHADFRALRGRKLRMARRHIQMIFQEAMSAMNPRFSALEIVAEPMELSGEISKQEIATRALALMESVGLRRTAAEYRMHQFSGGQKQRLALARALAAGPKIIILDEAVSGLDLSIQGQMINFLLDLQETRDVAYLFVTHDLRLAGVIADEIAVMKNGAIVECGSPLHLFESPQHPYTQALIASMQADVGVIHEAEVLT